jgi:ABC-type transport system substrate-binding protein
VENQLAELCACVFSGLLRLEDGVLGPDLAERWEADPSARRYRFHLRPGISFHDGVLLTARDVKRHFERLLDPTVKSPDRGLLEDVEGARAFLGGQANEVAGIEVLDDLTLEIRLEEPKAFFLHLMALPRTAVARMNTNGHAVGTGPFRQVVGFESNHITLERNPTYWRKGQPLLDQLEFHLLESREQAVTALQEGGVDIVSHLFPTHVGSLEMQGHQVVTSTTPSTSFLGFNLREAPYNDVRIRKALRAGMDIQALVDRFHEGARVARTVTPPELLDDEGLLFEPTLDINLAERLLREAGVRTLPLTIYFAAGRDTSAEDTILFRPLVDAGLVELKHMELRAEEFAERRREGRLPAFRVGWIADFPDPDNFLYFHLHSKAQTVYSLGYRNTELDKLTTEARITIDPEQRKQLYRRAERLAYEDCPIIPLFHHRVYAAANGRVQGLRLHQTPPQVRFEDLWMDKQELEKPR